MVRIFLSLDEVLEIHDEQIERYGGGRGIRDTGGLESAVATPQATFGGEFPHESIPAMAAAYLFHLCQNHVRMNDWQPDFGEDEFADLVIGVIRVFGGRCGPTGDAG